MTIDASVIAHGLNEAGWHEGSEAIYDLTKRADAAEHQLAILRGAALDVRDAEPKPAAEYIAKTRHLVAMVLGEVQ